jgi:HK97 family phage portal protein
MKLPKRIQVAFKVLTAQNLANSIGGIVARNYNDVETVPINQVKGITYKAIDKIGASLSVYEPIIKKKNGDALINHPFYNLFDNPNTYSSASDFVHLYGMLYEIYGESFWYLARGETSRKVKEVYLLNPAQMEVKVYNGELVGYILHKSDGQQVPFELEEIIHDKRPNPFNEWRGMSVLERSSTYVDTENTASSFTLNYLKNNASPSGIVSLPNMSKETFNQFATQWREGYEGPENAGKTAFIRGGEASFKAVGATLREIDAKALRDMAKDDVLMMLEVPKPLLGATDGNGFGRGNLEALYYIFAKEKIEPLMKRLDHIYETILDTFGVSELTYEVKHESPIPEDKEFQLKNQTAGVNVWLTINEVREQQGLPPIDGGDNLTKEVIPTTKISLKKSDVNDMSSEDFRVQLIDTNDIYEKKLYKIMNKFVSAQEKDVIEKLVNANKAYDEIMPSVKEDTEALTLLMTPVLLDLMEKQIEGTANFISGETLLISPETRNKVIGEVKQIVGVYHADTIKAIEKTITDGVQNGESLVKLKKRVEATFTEAKGYRAERIARTESLKASNLSAEMVYKQNGYSTVRWFTNPRACEFCQSMHNETKTVGRNFKKVGDVVDGVDGGSLKVDYANITVPPLHPNCKCSIIPEKN